MLQAITTQIITVVIKEGKAINLHFNHLLQIPTLEPCFKDECVVQFLMEDLLHGAQTSHLGIHETGCCVS